MSRRSDTAFADETETEVEVDTTTEDTQDTQAPEPVQSDEPEAASEQADQPAEVDLGPFQDAVKASLVDQDETTGELPLASLEPVNVEFRKLDGVKAKNLARTWLEDRMKAALMGNEGYDEPSYQDARSFMQIKDGLVTKVSTPKQKVEVDPKTAYVTNLATLIAAYRVAATNVPDGVDPTEADDEATNLANGLQTQVESFQAWLDDESEEKSDAPEVSPIVRAAFKVAEGKSARGTGPRSNGGTRSPRHDVARHITQVFADKPSGTFLSVGDIAKAASEEYGEHRPSQGAIQARLFPKSGKTNLEGIVSVEKAANQARGARKE